MFRGWGLVGASRWLACKLQQSKGEAGRMPVMPAGGGARRVTLDFKFLRARAPCQVRAVHRVARSQD